ncbi:MAG: hypothetical protein AB7F28_06915 [Candidatus Margulisiibacteriota bacterium]
MRWLWGILGLALILPVLVFAQAPAAEKVAYVRVNKPIAQVKQEPFSDTKTTFLVYQSGVFRVMGDVSGYYLIQFLDGQDGWLAKEDGDVYEGPSPPPPEQMGYADVFIPPPETQLSVPVELSPTPAIQLAGDDGPQPAVPTETIVQMPIPESPYLDTPNRDSFRYPFPPPNPYPDLNLAGFYEGKISGRNYEPKSVTDPRWNTIRNDPIYNKLPPDVLVGDPRIELRYRFNVDGKLDEDLAVHYDIEQEPDFPGKYDIKVKYKKTEMTFWQFDSEFKNGEFINLQRALDGFKLTSYDDNWETIVAVGRQRSEPRKYDTNGDGSNIIKLGNTSILEGSVKVFVNNGLKTEGVDYTINYYSGEITFKERKTVEDFIRVIYEFTNPIEDFLPVLSRKNFIGGQFIWRSTPKPVETKYSGKSTEELWPNPSASSNVTFKLKNSYLVLGTEMLTLNNRPLRKNKDYTLDQQAGTITLLDETLGPDDRLVMSYEYYQIEDNADDLIGSNSTGPYLLSRKNILFGTVSVVANGLAMTEGVDYTLDYAAGKLNFRFPIAYPSVITAVYKAVKSSVAIPKIKDATPFSVGVTYLNEYVRSQDQQLESAVPTETYTVSSNVFHTNSFPINPSKDVTVLVNGATANVVVSNPYTGEITIVSPVISGSAKVDVTYTYRKSLRTTAIFQVKNPRSDGLYSTQANDFFLKDTPVKYKGISYISIYRGVEIRLADGQDFISDYDPNGQQGQQLAIRFLKADPSNQSTLTDLPRAGERITIVYDYTPASSPDPGNIDQKMVGLTFGAKLTDELSVNTEVAGAQNNFERPKKSTTFTQAGTGQDSTEYILGQNNIVENSEYVYLDNRLQTKDRDYVINYLNGRLRFRNLTPGPNNTIRVDYDYFDTTAVTKAGVEKDFKFATKVGVAYKTDTLDIKTSLKNIDRDFVPLAPIQDPKGSTAFTNAVVWKLSPLETLSTDYNHFQIFRAKKDNNSDAFLNQDEFKVGSRLLFWDGYFDTTQQFRYFQEIQDPLTTVATENLHDVDSYTYAYDGSVSFGPDTFRTKITKGLARSTNDFLDRVALSDNYVDKTSLESTMAFRNVFLLGDTRFSPLYDRSQTTTVTQVSPTQNLDAVSTRTTYGFKSRFVPHPTLSMSANYDLQEIKDQGSAVSENVTYVRNNYYDADFNPFGWVQSRADYQRSEAESPLVGQKGHMEERTNFRISRFSPYGMATSALGVSQREVWLSPIRESYLSFDVNDSNTRDNNDKNLFNRNHNRLGLYQVTPWTGLRLSQIFWENERSGGLTSLETTTVSRNATTREYDHQGATFSVTPEWSILQLFTYQFDYDQANDKNLNNQVANSGTSNRTTENRPFFKRNQRLSFSPGEVRFLGISLGKSYAVLEENWNNNTNSRRSEDYLPDGTVVTTSVFQDNASIKTLKLSAGCVPFQTITLDGTVSSTNEVYNRNLNANAQGTTYKLSRDLLLTGQYTPWGFLSLNSKYALSTLSQYRSPYINTSLDSLLAAKAAQTDVFLDYLGRYQSQIDWLVTLTPISFFSVRTGLGYKVIQESYVVTASAQSDDAILQQITTVGSVLRPILNMDISYDYSVKQTLRNGIDNGQGYSGRTVLAYKPITWAGVEVVFSYERVDTWGKDLSDLDRDLSIQGTGNDIRTTILERKDSVETGSLRININIPLNAPYVKNLVITGEGYLKKIKNELDAFKGPDEPKTSYEISGMYLKGTLNF